MVADEVPRAGLVAGPANAIALRAGPPLHGPDEGARVGILLNALGGDLVALQGVLIGRARPSHIDLLHAGAGGADLPFDAVERAFGPKAGVEAEVGEGVDGVAQLHVAAAVAIVDQQPAAGHIILAVGLGHLDRVDGGHLLEGAVLVLGGVLGRFVAGDIGIGIAQLQTPARDEVGPTGKLGVEVQGAGEVGAHKVEGVEAVLVVGGLNGILGREVVDALREGVAQHAVAGVGHIPRRGVGVTALAPVAIGTNLNLTALVREVAILLAATIEELIGRGLERLGGAIGREIQGRSFGPNWRAIAVGQREGGVGLIDGELQGRGGEGERPLSAIIGEAHRGLILGHAHENLRLLGVVKRIGEVGRDVGHHIAVLILKRIAGAVQLRFELLRRGQDAKDLRRIELHAEGNAILRHQVKTLRDAALRHHLQHLAWGQGECACGQQGQRANKGLLHALFLYAKSVQANRLLAV